VSDTEREIKKAFDEIKADELTRKRAEIYVRKMTMDYGRDRAAQKRRKNRIAACIAAVLLTAGALSSWFVPATVISVDINPSLAMKVNVFDRVVSLDGLNDDGEVLAADLDLRAETYVRALRSLLLSDGMAPYLDDGSMVSVTVVGAESGHTEEMLANVACCALSVAEKENVYYCTVDGDTARAAKSAGLSPARYQALLLLQEIDPAYTAERVQEMSMREIRSLLSDRQMENPCEKASLN